MTRQECRRTLARLRLVRMAMRAEGKLLTQGWPITPSANTDVRRVWDRYGWIAPSIQREDREAA